VRRCLRVLLFCVAWPFAAHAQPLEHQTTTTWWTKQGSAVEGNPVAAFALPVVNATRLLGVLTLICPRRSERGAFFEIPMTVYPGGALKGKKVGTIIGINSQAFAGFVDDTRFLVYLNAPPLPPVPGMKIGTSVRAALIEGKGEVRVTTDPARPSGVVIKPARLEQTLPALVDYLRGQGLSPITLGEAIKSCDAFMKGAG